MFEHRDAEMHPLSVTGLTTVNFILQINNFFFFKVTSLFYGSLFPPQN